MDSLFLDENKKVYYPEDIKNSLIEVGARDCEGLFIHSDIMFGTPAQGFNRKEYLSILTGIIDDLGVKYLFIPTFTYSFCNGEDFDVRNSKTSMGVLNEYIRKKGNRYRTHDPLLSISVPVDLKSKFTNLSEHSLGEGSGLDILHHMDGIKILFFGATLSHCFTYIHYVEKIMNVPYRFDMEFSGKVIDESGVSTHRKQYMHTACQGVKPAECKYFEQYLRDEKYLKWVQVGNKAISCISEKDAYKEIQRKIKNDINYFLEQPFILEDLEYKYTQGLNGERITHC